MPLREQSAASTIMQTLKDDWVLRYGCPTYLLSDQGSNVDGKVIRELCETFNIKKRRSSAYHIQGNGFAERSIRNIREMMRTLLQDKKLPQTYLMATIIKGNYFCTEYIGSYDNETDAVSSTLW